ncbi:MAG: DNA-directed RNA polymerase subunit omega [Myxococcota bacterium]
MARITVEDCLENVSNRFSLVLVSAERAKQLLRGAPELIENLDSNKEVVVSLREIAAGKFNVDEGDVVAHDDWMPISRQQPAAQPTDEEFEDELPPEA